MHAGHEEARTAYGHLGTYEVFHPRMSTAPIDPAASEARYGVSPSYGHGAAAAVGSGDAFAFAEAATSGPLTTTRLRARPMVTALSLVTGGRDVDLIEST